MKLVILDGYTTNPGDLSWDVLDTLADVTVYDRTAPEETAARIGNASMVLTNKTVLSAEILRQCPQLTYIGVLATGYNIVDLEYCDAHRITVANVPSYSADGVAQMAIALLLELCMHVGEHSDAVHRGEWCTSPDFCFWKHPLMCLSGRIMCIVGFGQTGRRTAGIAKALGMRVFAVPHNLSHTPPMEGITFMSMKDGVRQADVLSLHCPLTEETRGMIGEAALARLKPSALIINTARGGLIDEQAVARALREGKLAGYAADGVSVEPMRPDNPLLGAPNCILTPHIAWACRQTRARLIETSCENIRAYLAGNPQNTVHSGR